MKSSETADDYPSMQRTPSKATLTSGSGTASGSTPNLTAYGCENVDTNVNVCFRKRKDRADEYDYKKDLMEFRSEIMNFLQDFGKTQIDNLKQIRKEISEVTDEIKTIKSVTENLTQRVNEISSEVHMMKSENTKILEKVAIIKTDIIKLQKNQNTDNHTSQSLLLSCEDIVSEFKDRTDREKNIIIVGITETNEKNLSTRRKYDLEEATKVIIPLYENCPKPINCMRLGKYEPEKSRPLKVCFDNSNIPKFLMRNKTKLPNNIMIYSDQTPAQRAHFQLLRDELKRRLSNGENDLSIKYIKNRPQIVKKKENSKN